MKIVKRILFGLLGLLLLLLVALLITGNAHIIRAMRLTYLKGHTTANINDYRDFDTHVIRMSQAQAWTLHKDYNKKELSKELESYLKKHHSAAFLIIKDGKLHTEKYFSPYTAQSKVNSFSMAKTITTMLVGAAIDEGKISGFDEPVSSFIPELKGKAKGVTLAHLSAMSSGIDWDENYYSPFSPTPKLLYGYDVENFSLSRKYSLPAGSKYYYASVSTQVLGIALKHAIKENLSDYLSKTFWQPLGMNDDGLWHTDTHGMELTFCCISTNARNFAKIGQLLLQKGKWRNRQLLNEKFIERMVQADLTHYYGHSIWIDDRDEKNPQFYSLIGHLGQYIAVVPAHNMIVVRLGEERGKKPDKITHFVPEELSFFVEQAIELVSSP